MAENEIKITYEVLFDLFRREKNREELQKLDSTFFEDVIAYMKEKNNILQEKIQKNESKDEIKKMHIQLENINKLVKELYERRERKILTMALNKVRINQNIINTSSLLAEEKMFFDQLIELLSFYRNEILEKVGNQQKPTLIKSQPINQLSNQLSNTDPNTASDKNNQIKSIRFIVAMPKFMGEQMEVYGPFQQNDVTQLPAKLADLLISKGKAKAEEVQQVQQKQEFIDEQETFNSINEEDQHMHQHINEEQ